MPHRNYSTVREDKQVYTYLFKKTASDLIPEEKEELIPEEVCVLITILERINNQMLSHSSRPDHYTDCGFSFDVKKGEYDAFKNLYKKIRSWEKPYGIRSIYDFGR